MSKSTVPSHLEADAILSLVNRIHELEKTNADLVAACRAAFNLVDDEGNNEQIVHVTTPPRERGGFLGDA